MENFFLLQHKKESFIFGFLTREKVNNADIAAVQLINEQMTITSLGGRK
jgi:hypothetical protein